MPKTAYANASSAVALSFAAIFLQTKFPTRFFCGLPSLFSHKTGHQYTLYLFVKKPYKHRSSRIFFVNDDVINDGSGVTRNLDFWLLVDVSSWNNWSE